MIFIIKINIRVLLLLNNIYLNSFIKFYFTFLLFTYLLEQNYIMFFLINFISKYTLK